MNPTITLRNGREVLAKLYQGELRSVTYANRTQAYKKQAELGDQWEVCQFLGRPFYVVRKEER